jgi:hypothetical protein
MAEQYYKEKPKPPTLFDNTEFENWKDQWVGMPEFVQNEQECYAEIIFRFTCEEDLRKFADLIGQKLSKNTKSAWYPSMIRGFNSRKRYMDEP